MAQTQPSSRHSLLLLLACTLFQQIYVSDTTKIGVNYGTVADNLPQPSKVATFLKSQTTIDRVKIFDTNPDILRAFAGTGISVTVTVGNGVIPSLSTLSAAQAWLSKNILPFIPETAVTRISVGNEVMESSDKTLIESIVPTMKSLHEALSLANRSAVQVSTPHSLGILASSEPPSATTFSPDYEKTIFVPMLDFLRRTKSPFMVNPYPFFAIDPTKRESVNYALFKPNSGIFDAGTSVNYTNMFDAQMDSVFSAMKKLGYDDVELVVAETGWPSVGDSDGAGASLENAASYNGNLIKHVNSGNGTPLMPGRTFETFIFSLFNENQKSSVSERNYGLFKPDLTPVYDVGVFAGKEASSPTSLATSGPISGATSAPKSEPPSGPSPTSGPKSEPTSGPSPASGPSPISGRTMGPSPTSGPKSEATSGPTSGPTSGSNPTSAPTSEPASGSASGPASSPRTSTPSDAATGLKATESEATEPDTVASRTPAFHTNLFFIIIPILISFIFPYY